MNNFDKDFDRMQKTIYIGWIVGLFLIASGLCFTAWVIIQLLQYFGVI